MFKIHEGLKILFLPIFYFFIVFTSSAQNFCNTPPSIAPYVPRNLTVTDPPGPFLVKLYAIIITKDDGTGGISEQTARNSIGSLLFKFWQHNIHFNLDCKIRYIKSTTRFNEDNTSNENPDNFGGLIGDLQNMNQQNNENTEDGINIFFGNPNYTGTHVGAARSIPSQYVVIKGSRNNQFLGLTQAFAHEIGHCLGLLHTFHGGYDENQGITPFCFNNPTDGSCGDEVEDTPADPNYTNYNCSICYTPHNCDILHSLCHNTYLDQFYPDPTIIMGYNFPQNFHCPDHFTVGQGRRMRYFLSSHPDLQNIVSPGNNWSGNEIIVSNALAPVIWDAPKSIGGTVRIRTGTTLIMRTPLNKPRNVFKFPKWKGIVVERGAKLKLEGVTLTKDCEDGWEGIYVEGFNNVEQPDPASNPVLGKGGIVETSLSLGALDNVIEYATVGIKTANYEDPTNGNYYGGVINCNNTRFIHNEKGVIITNYSSSPNKSRFNNCTFDGSGFTSSMGIVVNDTKNITVGFNNNFTNMTACGILAINAGVDVVGGNTFTNSEKGIISLGTFAFANNYLNVGKKTTSINSSNTFSNNKRHIDTYGTQKIIIDNNTFTSARDVGVWLDGLTNYSVYNNTFSNPYVGFVANGTWPLNSFSSISELNKNNFTNSFFGLTAQGYCENLKFLCNDFNTTWSDVVVLQNWNNGNQGRVYPVQNSGVDRKAADNTFSNYGGFLDQDITTIDDVKNFWYYYDILPHKEPFTIGYYTKVKAEGSSCREIPPFRNPDDTLPNINIIRNDIQIRETQGDNSSVDYIHLQSNKEAKLEEIVNSAINSGDAAYALSQLDQETSSTALLRKIGLFVSLRRFNDARTSVNALPPIIDNINDFKQLNLINIDRTEGEGNYHPNAATISYLQNIALGNSSIRSYARGLLTLFTGQMYSDDFTINLNGSIASRESKSNKNEQIMITPNPVNDVVEIKSNSNEIKTIEIFDNQGKSIVKNINVNILNYKLNVSEWSNGIYFTKIELSNKTTQFIKFVVTH